MRRESRAASRVGLSGILLGRVGQHFWGKDESTICSKLLDEGCLLKISRHCGCEVSIYGGVAIRCLLALKFSNLFFEQSVHHKAGRVKE